MNRDLIFAGRDQELNAALDLLHQSGQICISGDRGVGKSTFLRHLVESFRERHAETTWALSLELAHQISTWSGFEKTFLDRLRSPAGLDVDLASVREAKGGIEAFLNRVLPKWQALHATGQSPLLLVGLDDVTFGTGGSLFDVLQRLENLLVRHGMQVRYVVACGHIKPGDLSDVRWLGRGLLEFRLDGPTVPVVKEYASALGLDQDTVDALGRENFDSWADVHLRIATLKPPRAGDYWSQRAEDLLTKFSEEHGTWIMKASLLNELSEDSMAVLFPGKPIISILTWFEEHFSSYLEKDGKHLVINETVATAMRRLYHRRSAGPYGQDLKRAEKYNALFAMEQTQDGRRNLIHFDTFNYFNDELVRKVFPNQGEQLMGYVEARRDLFHRGDAGNWKLRPDTRNAVREFGSLIQARPDEERKARIRQIWDEKKTRVTDSITQGKVLLDNLKADLLRIQRQIQSCASRPVRAPGGSQPAFQFPRMSPVRMVSGIGMQLAGIAVIYMDLVINESFSLGNLAAGSVFVALGVAHFKGRMRDQEKAYAAFGQRPSYTRAMTGQLRLMEERASQIENQIQRTKQQIQVQQKILEEPYIFAAKTK